LEINDAQSAEQSFPLILFFVPTLAFPSCTLTGGGKPGTLRSAGARNGTPRANGVKVSVRHVVISRRASSPKAGKAQTKRTPSLPTLLLAILTEAACPMTVRELAKEARRRGFRTKSKNFAKSVESRAYDLQKRGLIRHPEGRPGYELNGGARQAPARRAKPSKATGPEQVPLLPGQCNYPLQSLAAFDCPCIKW
jgi:hypothetical protein